MSYIHYQTHGIRTVNRNIPIIQYAIAQNLTKKVLVPSVAKMK